MVSWEAFTNDITSLVKWGLEKNNAYKLVTLLVMKLFERTI